MVDTAGDTIATDRENKLYGEIVNVVREEREWRKMAYWPVVFGKREGYGGSDSEEEEESRMGKMPFSDEEDED